MKQRLLAAWHSASPAERRAGAEWYPTARRHARRIAREGGISLSQAAGVIAALSPRCRWEINLRRARHAVAGQPAGLGPCKEKALAILAGSRPLSVLKGPKERAFYRAIMGDAEAVTVDVHCWRAVGGTGQAPGKHYHVVAEAYRAAAREAGVPPAALQATVWIIQRNGGQRPLF